MRNMVSALLLSHGVPMLQMGDEYGHSKSGNNNTYCHDDHLNWVDWQQVRLVVLGCEGGPGEGRGRRDFGGPMQGFCWGFCWVAE